MTRDEYWIDYCRRECESNPNYRKTIKPIIERLMKRFQTDLDRQILKAIINGK